MSDEGQTPEELGREDKRARAERRFVTKAMNGLNQALNTEEGRAFIWWLYSENVDAEGKGGKGQRGVARELLKAARVANFAGLQQMRVEFERPKLGTRAEAQGEEE